MRAQTGEAVGQDAGAGAGADATKRKRTRTTKATSKTESEVFRGDDVCANLVNLRPC